MILRCTLALCLLSATACNTVRRPPLPEPIAEAPDLGKKMTDAKILSFTLHSKERNHVQAMNPDAFPSEYAALMKELRGVPADYPQKQKRADDGTFPQAEHLILVFTGKDGRKDSASIVPERETYRLPSNFVVSDNDYDAIVKKLEPFFKVPAPLPAGP